MAMVAANGSDGIPQDVPVIAYTEKILEEKELELRKYIEDNYLKIRNVEKELAELTLQVKLTAGPKKAALEHLRKKIEISGEKIKKAKLKEEQAKKVWEAAQKALQDEEVEKKGLCDDLKRLVEESASAQFARLEELKTKLESLSQPSVPAVPVIGDKPQQETCEEHDKPKPVLAAGPPPPISQVGRGRAGGGGRGRGKNIKNSLSLQSKAGTQSGWTGAGFDVENTE